MFETLGTSIHRHRWLTLALSGLFLAASFAMLVHGGRLTSGSIHGLEAGRAQALVEEVLGHPMETTFVAIFVPRQDAAGGTPPFRRDAASGSDPGSDPTSPAFVAAMRAALAPVAADPRVLSVAAPYDAPPLVAERLVSRSAPGAMVLITLRGDFDEAIRAYPAVRAQLRSDVLAITCTGHLSFMDDLGRTLDHDLVRAEIVSLPLALLVLLFVFRTVVAAVLPVGIGALAVIGGIAVVLGLSHGTDVAQYTVNVCSLIGLGVAIDYSLFTVSRYREELAAGHDYPAALARAMATAGRVVAFSGLAVGTGLAGLFFFSGSYLFAVGVGGVVVVALSVIFALTFLPALLAVLGPRIHVGRFPLRRREATGPGAWHRFALWVMRRPIAVLVPTLAVLLCLGLPFFHLRMAAADVRVLPASVEARRGYELLRQHFPGQGSTRHVLAVRFPTAPALTADRVGALYDLARRAAAIPGVSRVEGLLDSSILLLGREGAQRLVMSPPEPFAALIGTARKLTVGEHVVVLYALGDAPPASEEARRIVAALRAERAVGDGGLLVGGEAANDVDATAYMMERAPRAIAFVIVVTVLVLLVLLRSLVLPIKAVLMNIVSIAGSFGAVVWIFQDGHLLGIEGRPLEPSLPVLLFCILFGLSMDYEVLMLSRMKEAFARHGDNTRAVAEGLEKTAGLITSAAAIMVAVFAAFGLARVVLIQAVGVGTALAVALDATLVRVLLVPATMRLFGDLNWWLPGPLARLLPAVHKP